MLRHAVLALLAVGPILTRAQTDVRVDGSFDDWASETQEYLDSTGDGGSSGIDLQKIIWANDDEFLFLSFELGKEIKLQQDNVLELLIDADDDVNTGKPWEGRGIDLAYTFGDRSGWMYKNGDSSQIGQFDIGLVQAPTVSSERFEIALNKDMKNSGSALFRGNRFHFVLRDKNGDRFPDSSFAEAIHHSNGRTALPQYRLARGTDELRVLSYNVLRDGLFKSGQSEAMKRLLTAIDPDIIGFQEIYNHSSSEVAAEIESILPSDSTEIWYHAQAGPDIITLSRYPIADADPIGANGAFWIELGQDKELLLINAHPPCCSNDAGRQNEFDEMMAYLRDAKDGTGPDQLENESPIIILGDMNLVGWRQQLKTMLEGDIQAQSTYGSAFVPDWDTTALEDSRAPTIGRPMNFTWYQESSSYSPGRLDFIAYSGSVMDLNNAFVLFSPGLPQDSLQKYTLNANDAILASDHLPIVADFELQSTETGSNTLDRHFGIKAFPNPGKGEIQVELSQSEHESLHFQILDGQGNIVHDHELPGQNQGAGAYKIDLSGLVAGTYILRCLEEPSWSQKIIWTN